MCPENHRCALMGESVPSWLAIECLALAVIGRICALGAAVIFRRFAGKSAPPTTAFPGVTILKPLRGVEPGLYDNLASICELSRSGANTQWAETRIGSVRAAGTSPSQYPIASGGFANASRRRSAAQPRFSQQRRQEKQRRDQRARERQHQELAHTRRTRVVRQP